MMNKTGWILLFVVALVDDFLSFCFPVDLQYQSFGVVFHLSFCVLCFLCFHQERLNQFLYGFLSGLLIGMLFDQSPLILAILYSVILFICAQIYAQFEASNGLMIMIILFGVFLLDTIPYAYLSFSGKVMIPFFDWVLYQEVSTILFHGLALTFMEYCRQVMQRFMLIRQHRKKKAR